jgi:hypothetical protein
MDNMRASIKMRRATIKNNLSLDDFNGESFDEPVNQ